MMNIYKNVKSRPDTSGFSGKKIKLCFAFVMLLFFDVAVAQEIEWENTIGGSGDDNLNSISQTSDGGYICGGASFSNMFSNPWPFRRICRT